MTAVAIRGLIGRRTRTILTALAIVLGVAMVSGTYVLTDTTQKAFNGFFSSAYRGTSVTISGKEFVKDSTTKPTVPDHLVADVRRLPGVKDAAGGLLFRDVKLIGRSGRALAEHGAPSFGFGVAAAQPRFNPVKLTAGTWPRGAGQIVMDRETAAKHHYALGDTIGAKANGPVRHYRVTGLAQVRGVSVGGATVAVFDVPTAQAILGERHQLDSISVLARAGVSPGAVARQIRPLLPQAAVVRTAQEETKKAAKDITQGTSAFRTFLLVFAAIALFVGAFVIFNTISITVAQRTRELATLRTLGASRRQVLRSVLLESLAIGLVASVIGLAAGVGLAKGLDALFGAIGAELPSAGTVIATRTVVVSLLVGTLVTLAAGLFPALRATRVPPISAVREGATLPAPRHPHVKPIVAGALIVLGLTGMAGGLFGGGGAKAVLSALAGGTLLLFIGIGMVSSHLVRPLAALVGWPARHLGGDAGRLASANAVRNPSRTASTAAALMIGLALVAFVATLGGGIRSSVHDALDQQVTGDYVVTPSGETDDGDFPAQAGAAIGQAPGITVSSSVRADQARVLGKTTEVVGVDPATIARVYHFRWRHGSDAALAGLAGGVIVDSKVAADHHLRVGSRLPVLTPDGTRRTLTVRATYRPPQADPLFTGVVIARSDFDAAFPHPSDSFTFARAAGGATAAETARLKHVLDAFPDARVQTRAGWAKGRAAEIDKLLQVFYVLLALSVLVSLFGMVNTQVLSVFERTREIGMLRAIGMTRRQTRRMVRHESVITALIGAALGLPLGVGLAALVTSALGEQGMTLHLPIGSLAAFTAVAVAAGLVAAIGPARRASRMDVLQALSYE